MMPSLFDCKIAGAWRHDRRCARIICELAGRRIHLVNLAGSGLVPDGMARDVCRVVIVARPKLDVEDQNAPRRVKPADGGEVLHGA